MEPTTSTLVVPSEQPDAQLPPTISSAVAGSSAAAAEGVPWATFSPTFIASRAEASTVVTHSSKDWSFENLFSFEDKSRSTALKVAMWVLSIATLGAFALATYVVVKFHNWYVNRGA